MLSKLLTLGRALAASGAPAGSEDRPAPAAPARRSLMTKEETRRLAEARRAVATPAAADGDADGGGSGTLWAQRLKDNKLGALGVGLWAGLVVFFLVRVRRRKLPLQMYLIQLRVGAQAVCIGCITLGCFYAAMNNAPPGLPPAVPGNSKDPRDT